MTNDELRAWLDEAPPNILGNDNNSEFVPIDIIEQDLNALDPMWGDENYKFKVFNVGKFSYISGSIELVINYFGRTRRIIGAATVTVEFVNGELKNIENAEAKVLSECRKNAAKRIGRRFGLYLNRGSDGDFIRQDHPTDNLPVIPGKRTTQAVAKKLQPDASVMKSYLTAIAIKDQKMIDRITEVYDIKIENNAEESSHY